MAVLLSTSSIIGIIVAIALIAINIAVIIYILQKKPAEEELTDSSISDETDSK